MEKEIRLLPLREAKTIAFKEEMQEAFQHGFQSYYKDDNQWQVLPDKDFYQSLEAEGAEAYEAIDTDGQRVGGAIIAIDSASSALRTARISVRCASATCMPQPMKSSSASMLVRPRNHHSPPYSQT